MDKGWNALSETASERRASARWAPQPQNLQNLCPGSALAARQEGCTGTHGLVEESCSCRWKGYYSAESQCIQSHNIPITACTSRALRESQAPSVVWNDSFCICMKKPAQVNNSRVDDSRASSTLDPPVLSVCAGLAMLHGLSNVVVSKGGSRGN